MDKTREAFDKAWRAIDGDNYPFSEKKLCFSIFESRNPEITELSSRVAVVEGKVIEQEGEIKKLREALKDLVNELTLSNDLGELAIDGRHMNIYMAWLEAEKVLEGGEG